VEHVHWTSDAGGSGGGCDSDAQNVINAGADDEQPQSTRQSEIKIPHVPGELSRAARPQSRGHTHMQAPSRRAPAAAASPPVAAQDESSRAANPRFTARKAPPLTSLPPTVSNTSVAASAAALHAANDIVRPPWGGWANPCASTGSGNTVGGGRHCGSNTSRTRQMCGACVTGLKASPACGSTAPGAEVSSAAVDKVPHGVLAVAARVRVDTVNRRGLTFGSSSVAARVRDVSISG